MDGIREIFSPRRTEALYYETLQGYFMGQGEKAVQAEGPFMPDVLKQERDGYNDENCGIGRIHGESR